MTASRAACRAVSAAAEGALSGGTLEQRYLHSIFAELCAIDLAEPAAGLRRAAVAHRDQSVEDSMRAQIGQTISEVPEALVRVMQEREAKIVGPASGLPGFDNVSSSLKPFCLRSNGRISFSRVRV